MPAPLLSEDMKDVRFPELLKVLRYPAPSFFDPIRGAFFPLELTVFR